MRAVQNWPQLLSLTSHRFTRNDSGFGQHELFCGAQMAMTAASRWLMNEPMNLIHLVGLLSTNAIVATLLADTEFIDREVRAPYGLPGGRLSPSMAVWLSLTTLFMLAHNLRVL